MLAQEGAVQRAGGILLACRDGDYAAGDVGVGGVSGDRRTAELG